MTGPQRCGTVDNPHIFVKDLRRCHLCNKHIRDIHVSDHIINTVTCKCGNNCEASSKDTDCPCYNIPCEDDEGICEYLHGWRVSFHPWTKKDQTRGCLHEGCECECEF